MCDVKGHNRIVAVYHFAPNQAIARSEFEVHPSNVYGVNVTKAVIGAYI